MSHMYSRVNEILISWLQKKYGVVSSLTLIRGVKHEYLRMTLDFTEPGKKIVTIYDNDRRVL